MKLTKRNDVDFSGDVLVYDVAQESNPRFKHEVTVSTGYTELTSLTDWNNYGQRAIKSYKDFRNELINNFISGWAGYSDSDKKILVTHYIWDSAESIANLDLLYTQQQRDDFQNIVMNILNSSCECNIRKSITTNSTKYFDIQVDDSGIVTTIEIKSDQTFN